jgi:hypothetical protein
MAYKIGKKLLWPVLTVLAAAVIAVVYLFNKPHRDVQSTKAFAVIQAKDLLTEFSADASKANAKYLSDDGNSKVIVVIGKVRSIAMNQRNEKVVLLKDASSKAGVSCTFTQTTSKEVEDIQVGDTIKVKGAIAAGNSYDADLDLYNDAVLVECTVIK